jgi:hypothetical protein
MRGLAPLLVETNGEWLDIASVTKQRDVDGARRFLRIGMQSGTSLRIGR